jgi:hypothetical protein
VSRHDATSRCRRLAWPVGRTIGHNAGKRQAMTTTRHVVSTARDNHQGRTDPAAADDTLAADDPASVAVLVEEAIENGVVDWLADQIVGQCGAHSIPLDGDGGLLPALAAAAQQRVRSRPSGPVRIVLTYDPTTQQSTADYAPGTTLATVRDACLGIALEAGDLHPAVKVHRAGVLFRCG